MEKTEECKTYSKKRFINDESYSKEFQDMLYKDVVLCLIPKLNGSGLYGPGIRFVLEQQIIVPNIMTSLVKCHYNVEDYAALLAEVSKNSWLELKQMMYPKSVGTSVRPVEISGL